MADVQWLEQAAPYTVPIITGLVAGAGLIVKDYRKAKSADHRYRQRLEKAQLEVQFLHSWLQARQELGMEERARPQAMEWLERCYKSVHTVETEVMNRHRRRPVNLRRLFLLRPLSTTGAKAVRVLYWLAVAWFNFLGVSVAREIVAQVSSGGEQAAAEIGYAVGGFIILGPAPVLVFRAWCTSLDRIGRLVLQQDFAF